MFARSDCATALLNVLHVGDLDALQAELRLEPILFHSPTSSIERTWVGGLFVLEECPNPQQALAHLTFFSFSANAFMWPQFYARVGDVDLVAGEGAFQRLMVLGRDYPMTRTQLKLIKASLSQARRDPPGFHRRLTYFTTDGTLNTSIVGLSKEQKRHAYPPH